MNSHSLKICWSWLPVSALAALVLAGCATKHPDTTSSLDPVKGIKTDGKEAQLTRYRMKNWAALDDHTVIIEAYDGTRYKGETLGPCLGLGYSPRLAFKNRSGFQDIDRFSTIVLPDGTTCQMQTFSKVITAEGSALDSYEDSQKEKSPDEAGKEAKKKKKI